MAHRIRYTMTQEPLSSKVQGTIEIDEAYVGGKLRKRQPQAVKPGERQQDRVSPVSNKAACRFCFAAQWSCAISPCGARHR